MTALACLSERIPEDRSSVESSSLASSEPPITCNQGHNAKKKPSPAAAKPQAVVSHPVSLRRMHCALLYTFRTGWKGCCPVRPGAHSRTSTDLNTTIHIPRDGKGSSSGAFSVTGSTSSVVSRLLAFMCSVYTSDSEGSDHTTPTVLEPSKPPATKTLLSSNDATAQPLRPTPRSNRQHPAESSSLEDAGSAWRTTHCRTHGEGHAGGVQDLAIPIALKQLRCNRD